MRTGDIANKFRVWLTILFCFVTLFAAEHAAAAAQMQITDLQNYRLQSFTSDGGLSVDSLMHVTRVQDGRVVIVGTRGAPVIFDGVRFSKPAITSGQRLHQASDYIRPAITPSQRLRQASDYIRPAITSGQRIDTESGALMSLQTPDGALWFASQKAGLLRLKCGELRPRSDIETASLALSRDQKRVLVGAPKLLLRFENAEPKASVLNKAHDALARNFEHPFLAQQNQLCAVTNFALVRLLALPNGASIEL